MRRRRDISAHLEGLEALAGRSRLGWWASYHLRGQPTAGLNLEAGQRPARLIVRQHRWPWQRLDDDELNHALLAALDGLARLEAPVLERVFSVRVLNNSKRFEALRGDVLHLLRRFSPQAGVAALQAHACPDRWRCCVGNSEAAALGDEGPRSSTASKA